MEMKYASFKIAIINSKHFFSTKRSGIFNNICTIIDLAGHQDDQTEWRLRIEVSKLAYKL
jgi:hypothetical protein